jgi:tripartite-type tricarboxylate transporter receptor subunit TctC
MRVDGLLFGAAALAAVAGAAAPSAAADVADFYKGKTVTVLVGYPGSSGYTFYNRTLARHIGAHVPGKPNAISQNMPGAASMTAANWIYNVAPRDGTLIGMFAAAVTIDGLFGNSAAKFDATKFTWIGNMDRSVGTCSVWHTSGIKRFDDLLTRAALFGGTGPAAGITQHALALKNLFGARIKVIPGYGGGQDIVLAMERGEVQGQCAVPVSTLKTEWADKVARKEIIPIIHDSMTPSDELSGVPSVYDYAKNDDDRRVLDLVFGWHVLGRPVAGPPGLPAERADALRAAFLETMKDPAFLAEAEKQHLDIKPSSGDEVAAIIARFFASPASVIERADRAVRDR